MLAVIRDLAARGMTMIVVTHEIGFARVVADTVAFLDGGRIVESGPPASLLTSPRHQRARAFPAASCEPAARRASAPGRPLVEGTPVAGRNNLTAERHPVTGPTRALPATAALAVAWDSHWPAGLLGWLRFVGHQLQLPRRVPIPGSAAPSAGSTAIPTQDVVSGITEDPKLHAELPASVRSSGQLILGTTLTPGTSELPHEGRG